VDRGLRAALTRARDLGYLGPGPLEDHVEHALGLAALIGGPPEHFLDLGAGGGIPGLVLAQAWPRARGALLESGARRSAHLRQAVRELGLAERVTIVEARAEEAGRSTEWRARFGLVVARAFGPPAVTAECGVAFLEDGGELVVSDPPGGAAARWDEGGLSQLGLAPAATVAHGRTSIARMAKLGPVDDRWPRRTGVPARRPLWR
jgi:16S rRNA (guanine527-N7)-methyltransferase